MTKATLGIAAILSGIVCGGMAHAGSYSPAPADPVPAAAPAPVKMRYIPPVTNPTFNETPFITTEIRPIYIHHDIVNTGGGNADVFAVQARFALTDRLALIATKDGYADVDTGALGDDDGFLNIGGGLKYAVINDLAGGTIVSVGARYEAPLGDIDLLGGALNIQGKGDGFANFFITGVKQIDRFQIQASANAHIAIDNDTDSSLIVGSLHANYALTERFFPLLELNVFEYFDEPNRNGLGLPIEGFDVFHLGAADSDTVVTGAAGFRFLASEKILVGGAFEIPLTDEDDGITNWRVTADAVIRF